MIPLKEKNPRVIYESTLQDSDSHFQKYFIQKSLVIILFLEGIDGELFLITCTRKLQQLRKGLNESRIAISSRAIKTAILCSFALLHNCFSFEDPCASRRKRLILILGRVEFKKNVLFWEN